MEHIIPPMTHPLSTGWRQPKRDNILIDEHHAILSQRDFDELFEYSASIPTGVYAGKMWKTKTVDEKWFLVWFGYSEKGENYCSNNFREIIIVEDNKK